MPHKLFVKGKNASTHKCPFGKFNKPTWVAVPETQTFRQKVFFCRNVCVCHCFWPCTFLGDLFWECLLFSYVILHKLFVPLWKTVPVHHNTLQEDRTGGQQEEWHTVWLCCLSKRRSGPGGRALPHHPLLCADLRVPLNAVVGGSFSSLLFQNTLHHTLTIHSKHAKHHKSQLCDRDRCLSRCRHIPLFPSNKWCVLPYNFVIGWLVHFSTNRKGGVVLFFVFCCCLQHFRQAKGPVFTVSSCIKRRSNVTTIFRKIMPSITYHKSDFIWPIETI